MPINFLILDEPTNHLDIDSREVLETAINEFDGTVLFISHDRYFLNQVATDILYMTTHGMTHYEGNYDDYLAQQAKLEHQTQPEAKAKQSTGQLSYQQSKETQRARRKLQRQVDQLENQMGELETKQAAIEAEMAKPEIAVDIAQLTDLQKKLDALKAQSEDVELQWTEAAEALETFDQENQ